MLEHMYDIVYYTCILFFGVYVSVRLACGTVGAREQKAVLIVSPMLLIAQGIVLWLWGIDMVWKLYPVIVHLPLVLAIIFWLKSKWDVALISVVISYSFCQFLRWIGLVIHTFGLLPILSLVIHLSLCYLLFLLFNRLCMGAIHDIIERSAYLRRWFGALPVLYYIYEYFTLYTQNHFAESLVLIELQHTAMLLFFVLYAIIYQRELEKREEFERQNALLETELSQAANEISLLRVIEEKTAIHRHDLRHHLLMIENLLSTDKSAQVSGYIREVVGEIESIAPVRYCEHEFINLLVSYFKGKADKAGISMVVKAALPNRLSIPDIELCVMMSNGLENAINTVSSLPDSAEKRIDLFFDVKQNSLLIEIKNPYTGEIIIQNGLPIARNGEIRYGCRSIQSIAVRRNGNCIFDAANGIFILRIAIPLEMAL